MHILSTPAEKNGCFKNRTRVGTSNSLRVWGSPESRFGGFGNHGSDSRRLKRCFFFFLSHFFGDLGVVFPMCLLDVFVGFKNIINWNMMLAPEFDMGPKSTYLNREERLSTSQPRVSCWKSVVHIGGLPS